MFLHLQYQHLHYNCIAVGHLLFLCFYLDLNLSFYVLIYFSSLLKWNLAAYLCGLTKGTFDNNLNGSSTTSEVYYPVYK